jgi:hypothetical protein
LSRSVAKTGFTSVISGRRSTLTVARPVCAALSISSTSAIWRAASSIGLTRSCSTRRAGMPGKLAVTTAVRMVISGSSWLGWVK